MTNPAEQLAQKELEELGYGGLMKVPKVLFVVLFILFAAGALAQAPTGFSTSFSYSSDEPKIYVTIFQPVSSSGFFDKIEYSLERVSSSCSDAATVSSSKVNVPLIPAFIPDRFEFLYVFEIPTTNYGAFNLSITTTKNGQSKTIEKTVYVEIVNDYDPFIGVGSDQIYFLSDSDPAFIDINLNTSEQVSYTIEALGTTDRQWCGRDGQQFTVKNGVNVFRQINSNNGDDRDTGLQGLAREDSRTELHRIFLPELAFDNNLFYFFKVTVRTSNELLYEKEHLIMNCLSNQFPTGEDCSSYNDIGR